MSQIDLVITSLANAFFKTDIAVLNNLRYVCGAKTLYQQGSVCTSPLQETL
jgi:hypothetical protein